jgi:uncharacterized repeat protein (TIGR01451 family)
VNVQAVADLSITKSSSPTQATVGLNFDYTLEITNNSPDTATALTVVDTLPTGMTFVSASAGCVESAGTVTCTTASLVDSASVAFKITVSPPILFGNISNTASVTSSTQDPATGNNSITLVTFVTVPPGVPIVGTWGLIGLATVFVLLILWAYYQRNRSGATAP